MKKLILMIVLSSCTMFAQAGLDDAQLDLGLTAFSFEVFESVTKTYDQIQLDIEQSPRVFKANGALKYSVDGDGFPVTGTCALTPEDMVFCAINASFATIYLDLNLDLSGTYLLLGPDGMVIGEGVVTFISLT